MTNETTQFKEDGLYTEPKTRWFRGHFITGLQLRDKVME